MIFHFKSRKNKLRHALINWINDGYPIGNRPEDELKEFVKNKAGLEV